MKVDLAVMKGALKRFVELAAKDATEHPDGKKEIVAWFDPAGVIGRPCTEIPLYSFYKSSDVGLDTEMFAYFTLSIFWRRAIQPSATDSQEPRFWFLKLFPI